MYITATRVHVSLDLGPQMFGFNKQQVKNRKLSQFLIISHPAFPIQVFRAIRASLLQLLIQSISLGYKQEKTRLVLEMSESSDPTVRNAQAPIRTDQKWQVDNRPISRLSHQEITGRVEAWWAGFGWGEAPHLWLKATKMLTLILTLGERPQQAPSYPSSSEGGREDQTPVQRLNPHRRRSIPELPGLLAEGVRSPARQQHGRSPYTSQPPTGKPHPPSRIEASSSYCRPLIQNPIQNRCMVRAYEGKCGCCGEM